MANKILETLTIDGVPMDIHDVKEASDLKTIDLNTPNTFVNGASITLEEKGVYLVRGYIGYTQATTTGTTIRTVRIQLDGVNQVYQNIVDANNGAAQKALSSFVVVNTTPAVVTFGANCSKVCTNNSTGLKTVKIISL